MEVKVEVKVEVEVVVMKVEVAVKFFHEIEMQKVRRSQVQISRFQVFQVQI